MSFRDVLSLLRELQESGHTGPEADRYLRRARRLVRKARRVDPVKPREPIDGRSPIIKHVVITPAKVDFEMNGPAEVVRMHDGTAYPSLRKALQSWGPERGPVVVGVKGNGGYVQFGDKNSVVQFPLDITFVGLTGRDSIGPFVQKPEDDFPLLGLEIHNIGLVANKDSKAFHQRARIGRMILHNWWFIPLNGSEISQAQGWYCTEGWDLLVVSKYQPRETRFWEHIVYPKGDGAMQIIDNEMMGMGRCFVNQRPHGAGVINGTPFKASPKPVGDILFDGNHSDGACWDRPVMGGGALLTAYCGLENDVVFRNNVIKNCRTGAIMCGRGASNTNPYTTRDNYSFARVWLDGNDLHVNGKDGSDPRHCVNINDIRDMMFVNSNKFRSENRMDLQLNSAGYGGQPIDDIHVIGRDSLPDFVKGGIWIAALDRSDSFTPEDLIPEIE